MANETLGSLGERELLSRLAKYAPPGQLDDDAAFLENDVNSNSLVVNTDVFVETIHFSELTTRPSDLGWRATAATLSDLAATGCDQVIGLTVGLVAPSTTNWEWVAKVYKGLKTCLDFYGGTLLGGDCSEGAERILAITAFGKLGAGGIHRNKAKTGDWIVASGPHGLSRLGLALLQNKIMPPNQIPFFLRQQAIECHRRPNARFDIIKILDKIRPKNIPWRIGGTDSSDGLLESVSSLARTSYCHAKIDRMALPILTSMGLLIEKTQWCLCGGEDFELILSLPEDWARALIQASPTCQKIGVMVEKRESSSSCVSWLDNDEEVNGSQFIHFRKSNQKI